MGFTRYWKVRADVDQDRLIEAGRMMGELVRSSDVPLAGGDGTGEPVVDSETGKVWFNGEADRQEDYETFSWPPDLVSGTRASDDPDWVFDFCKTGRLPYDAVVADCLDAAQQALGDAIRVEADAILD
jgi:hypothetical protein